MTPSSTPIRLPDGSANIDTLSAVIQRDVDGAISTARNAEGLPLPGRLTCCFSGEGIGVNESDFQAILSAPLVSLEHTDRVYFPRRDSPEAPWGRMDREDLRTKNYIAAACLIESEFVRPKGEKSSLETQS